MIRIKNAISRAWNAWKRWQWIRWGIIVSLIALGLTLWFVPSTHSSPLYWIGVAFVGGFTFVTRVRALSPDKKTVDDPANPRQITPPVRPQSTVQPPVPHNLPPSTDHFVGRADDVATVMGWLEAGRAITLIGLGGQGKTALTWKVVHELDVRGELQSRFPDGVLFHSFYDAGAQSVDAACRAFAEQMGVPNDIIAPNPQRAFQHALTQDGRNERNGRKQLLLILDGAEDAEDGVLKALLEMRRACGALISTRDERDTADPRYQLRVGRMARPDAITLLQMLAGGYADDDAVANELCAVLHDTPFLIDIAGRYIGIDRQANGAQHYLNKVQGDARWGMTNPDDAADRHQNAIRLIRNSVAQVSEDGQAVLAVAGVVALLPFNEQVVAGTFGWDEARTDKAIRSAVSFGLLGSGSPPPVGTRHALSLQADAGDEGRWWRVTHPFVYQFVRDTPRGDVLARVGAYYTEMARRENERGLAGYNVLDGERAHIMAVLSRLHDAQNHGTDDPVHTVHCAQATNDLVWSVQDYMGIRGYWTERMRALEWGITAAQNANLKRDEGAHRTHLALSLSNLGRVEEAIAQYEQIISIFRELGDHQSEGAAFGNLGNSYVRLGRVEEAIEQYEQALIINKEIKDRRGEGDSLGNLGIAYYRLGRVEEAINYYEQDLMIREEIGDKRGKGNVLGNLGIAYYHLGRVEEAIEQYEQALIIRREIGDRSGEGTDLGNLGNAYRNLGQLDKAITYFKEGLLINREIGNRNGEASHLANMGLLHKANGQVADAKACWEQALALFIAIKSPHADTVRGWLDELR